MRYIFTVVEGGQDMNEGIRINVEMFIIIYRCKRDARNPKCLSVKMLEKENFETYQLRRENIH